MVGGGGEVPYGNPPPCNIHMVFGDFQQPPLMKSALLTYAMRRAFVLSPGVHGWFVCMTLTLVPAPCCDVFAWGRGNLEALHEVFILTATSRLGLECVSVYLEAQVLCVFKGK